jgi:putative restriction endonuclease
MACAISPRWRESARRLLITTHFNPEEQVALFELVGMPAPTEQEIRRDFEISNRADAEFRGREARFRITIVAAYNYTCALTGFRLTTVTGISVVDAAHIHQFADSRNNDPQNGIALCKNAHWLFDQGLWSVTDQHRVIVAIGKFAEVSPDQKALMQYHGEMLRLPKDACLWPNPVHLAWHRKRKFQGS